MAVVVVVVLVAAMSYNVRGGDGRGQERDAPDRTDRLTGVGAGARHS